MFSHVYLFLPLFADVCICLLELFNLCLLMFTYVTSQAKTDLKIFLTRMELLVSCYSPYLALSSGACGASICASVPEL